MTDSQEKHLLKIKQDFDLLVDPKYRKGAEEHGDDLSTHTVQELLDAAIEEAIDQITYLLTLRDKLNA